MNAIQRSRLLLTLKIVLPLLLVLLVIGGGLWAFGPREPLRLESGFDAATIGSDVEAYLARTEADIPNLRPGAQKEIVWAYPASKAKTPIALVYVHGFSASRDETRPLSDEVAKRLGANLFYTRLAGHGRDSAAMAEPEVGDWIDDFAEAMAIGRRLGERVIVIATSTGATLATLAASRPELTKGLAGIVEISPNFGVSDGRSWMLTMPFARSLIPYLGPEEFGTAEAEMTTNGIWTQRYPTRALLPMARLVEATQTLDVSTLRIPALFVYAPGDHVVDTTRTAEVAARWGGPHETVIVDDSSDPSQHVIVGAATSPNTTERLSALIAEWIAALPSPTT
ncbi:carboxylesterase [Aureimonas sp. AU4]|uniref:alpha/beta hydrolase n=1 Tax=Aureimonas sp. AU4 TaxID=1638163 RepID=UPI000781DDD1|nr:alpha/beta fold hydrolase [Aureimonas sp. AU4]